MSFDEHRIKVLSYQPCFVALSGRTRNVGLRPSDGVTPSVEYFSFDDIEFMNSTSIVLRSGLIEIEDSARDEVYKRLNILPENCLYERDIDELLLNPTMDGMNRIIAVNDALTLERIRRHMAQHYGVLTQNVIKVIESRARELANGVRKSSIEIEPVNKPKTYESQKVEELNKQVADLTALVQKLLGNTESTEPRTEAKEDAEAVAEKPQRGRTAKK